MAAMDFASARQRVRKLIADKKPSELSRSTLRPNTLRDNVIDEESSRTERFRRALGRKPEVEYDRENEDGTKERKSYEWDGFGDALRDVARAGYSFDDPELRPQQQILPSRQLNRELVRDYMRSDAFQESRPYTEGNATESVFGSLAASKSLQESAKTRLAEHIARSEEMGEAEGESQDAQDILDRLRTEAKEQHDSEGEIDPALVDQIKQQTAARQAARGKLEQLLTEQGQSTMAADVRASAAEAAEAGERAVRTMYSLPGLEAGSAQNIDPETQLELAEKWIGNEHMLKLAEVLGRRFPRFVRSREARSKNIPTEPVNVKQGRDLEKLLPHELARLHIPAMRVSFIKDYAEHALLQYESEGKEHLAHGPIVCVTDGSGSMEGEKFILASSIGLTLFKVARREKRAFAGVEFGSTGELKSWIFPKDETPDPMRVFDYASHFFGGGTDTASGMAEALRIIEESPEFETADVLLIADGQDHYGPDDERIRARLEKLGVRIHGITIKAPQNPYFDSMCEWHTDVSDLAKPETAMDLLAENIT